MCTKQEDQEYNNHLWGNLYIAIGCTKTCRSWPAINASMHCYCSLLDHIEVCYKVDVAVLCNYLLVIDRQINDQKDIIIQRCIG